jgi:hypothetical protein
LVPATGVVKGYKMGLEPGAAGPNWSVPRFRNVGPEWVLRREPPSTSVPSLLLVKPPEVGADHPPKGTRKSRSVEDPAV